MLPCIISPFRPPAGRELWATNICSFSTCSSSFGTDTNKELSLCWLRREWDQDWILRQLGQFQGYICRTWNIQSQPVQGWLFCWHISGPKAERQTRGSHSQEAPTEEDKSRQLLWTQTVQFQATDSFAKKQLKKDGSFWECEINFAHSVKVMLSVYQKVSLKKNTKFKPKNSSVGQWQS